MQRVLGEEHSIYSSHLREAKLLISQEIGPSRDRLVSAMIAAIAVCHAWADPSEQRKIFPDVTGELKIALRACQLDFQRAMILAAEKLGDNDQANIPIFAHLVRRMSAFSAIFSVAESLLSYLQKHDWAATEIHSSDLKWKGNPICRLCLQVYAFFNKSWKWHNPDSFRLAIKTSVGMLIASLFVSVDYLNEIATPFSVWPGLTIGEFHFFVLHFILLIFRSGAQAFNSMSSLPIWLSVCLSLKIHSKCQFRYYRYVLFVVFIKIITGITVPSTKSFLCFEYCRK
jgi:hypothetical protein